MPPAIPRRQGASIAILGDEHEPYLETNMNRLLGRLQSLALSALIIGPIWANDFFEQWFDGPGEIDG